MGCLASTANENGYFLATTSAHTCGPPARHGLPQRVFGAVTSGLAFVVPPLLLPKLAFSLLVSRVVSPGTFRVTGEQGVKKTGLGIVPIDRDSTFHVLVVSTLQSLVASSEQNLAKFVNTYVQHLFRRDRD